MICLFHCFHAYQIKIDLQARQKDATAAEQRLGNEMSQSLQKLIAPYFLRRTKQDVHKIETEEGSGSAPL